MEELLIYKFQADAIEYALKEMAKSLKCQDKETCFDRDVMVAIRMIENIKNKQPDKFVPRM